MGSTAIVYAVVALAVGVVCFFLGLFQGRSNLKAKVEQVVEAGAASLDAREFAMRQQLDDAVAEVARLRPLAEEFGRVQARLRVEQAEYDHLKADFNSAFHGESAQEHDGQTPEQPPAPESADEAIQKLLKSLELTMQEPGGQFQQPEAQQQPSFEPPARVEEQPAPVYQKPPVYERPPVREKPPVASVPPVAAVKPPAASVLPAAAVKPLKEPAVAKTAPSKAPVVDEWQEFARSLEDLTRRNQ